MMRRHPGRKRKNGSYFRRPKTIGSMRWSVAWQAEEGEPKPRGARSLHNLPEAWDDKPKATYRDRNWKAYRKHQWKVIT